MRTVLKVSEDNHSAPYDQNERARIAEALTTVLADSYVLMAKTQGVHWNAMGPLFLSLHDLTEKHYKDLFAAIDEIAERIRALGHDAPNNLDDMVAKSEISADVEDRSAERLIATLIAGHETTVHRVYAAIDMAEAQKDPGSADLLIERVQFHEKALWMLRSLIDA